MHLAIWGQSCFFDCSHPNSLFTVRDGRCGRWPPLTSPQLLSTYQGGSSQIAGFVSPLFASGKVLFTGRVQSRKHFISHQPEFLQGLPSGWLSCGGLMAVTSFVNLHGRLHFGSQHQLHWTYLHFQNTPTSVQTPHLPFLCLEYSFIWVILLGMQLSAQMSSSQRHLHTYLKMQPLSPLLCLIFSQKFMPFPDPMLHIYLSLYYPFSHWEKVL